MGYLHKGGLNSAQVTEQIAAETPAIIAAETPAIIAAETPAIIAAETPAIIAAETPAIIAELVPPLAEEAEMSTEYFSSRPSDFSGSGVVGSGATTSTSSWGLTVTGPTTAVGSAFRRHVPGTAAGLSQGKAPGVVAWGRRLVWTVSAVFTNSHANAITRITFGKNISDGVGALPSARRSVAILRSGTGALSLQVSNGTAVTTGAAGSFTPTSGVKVTLKVVVQSGTATLYANGTSVATCTGASTTDGGSGENGSQLEVENTGVTTAQITCTTGEFIFKYSDS